MKAVEQNSDLLNEIADAYLTTPGDARDAWQVIGICLAAERDLPDWVKGYLIGASAKVAKLVDMGETEKLGPDRLAWPRAASALGFYPESADHQTKPKWAFYDSLTVYSVIAGWQGQAAKEGRKLSLAKCFKRYVDEHLNYAGDEQTIKTTYYRGKAIAEAEIGLSEAIAERGSPLHIKTLDAT
jgi:hypothetical protein